MTCLHLLSPVVSHFLCNPKCDKTSLVQRVSKVQRRPHCPELQLADTADLHSAAVASCGFPIGVPAVAQMSPSSSELAPTRQESRTSPQLLLASSLGELGLVQTGPLHLRSEGQKQVSKAWSSFIKYP